MTLLAFPIAAAVGALIRHGVNRLGHGWRGTVVVNAVGAFVLAAAIAADVPESVLLVVGTAGCGSLTTFGMVAVEVVEARGPTRWSILMANLLATVVAAAMGFAFV